MIFVFHISLQAGMQVNIITSKLIVRILFFKNYEIRQDFYSRHGYHQVANKGMAPLYFTVSGLLPPVCSFKAEARERGRQPMHYDYCIALPTSSSSLAYILGKTDIKLLRLLLTSSFFSFSPGFTWNAWNFII